MATTLRISTVVLCAITFGEIGHASPAWWSPPRLDVQVAMRTGIPYERFRLFAWLTFFLDRVIPPSPPDPTIGARHLAHDLRRAAAATCNGAPGCADPKTRLAAESLAVQAHVLEQVVGGDLLGEAAAEPPLLDTIRERPE